MKTIFLNLFLNFAAVALFAQSVEEQQAFKLFESGKKAEAVAAFEKIITGNPNNLDAIKALGFIYLELGKNQEAYQVSSKGLSLNKNDDNLSINKARAAVKIGKADEAIMLMDACIARDANFFMPYVVKGNALDAQDKIQQAIGMYSKAIQLNPNFPNVYLDRGNDFVAISRYTQGIADYDKVISLAPESNEAFNMRGVANYRLEKYDEALTDYTKAIALGNFYAIINRGVVYKEQGKNDLAKSDFNKAIGLQPNNAGDAYFNLADVLLHEQNYDGALLNIEKAVAVRPNSALYQSLYASTLLSLKRDNDGLAAAEKVLALDAKSRDGFIYKATALSNLKRIDEAIKTITQGISVYPDFYLMYKLRSFIYKQNGKADLAEMDEAKAKQLGIKD
ncbi:tetratricopeptide repeat protein [Pedobacter foliorum]|uniref:tetratricopeptide repeat protein n=1 Tax=Pedobacter foliorum TaxID=2739058 RepID=UPI001565DB0A|nr:tetratricopeptide repeat protein [Pedobacter foliorum]NRF40879.1 tetratricopeptide repeat protein [Pedobacter foliorum]